MPVSLQGIYPIGANSHFDHDDNSGTQAPPVGDLPNFSDVKPGTRTGEVIA